MRRGCFEISFQSTRPIRGATHASASACLTYGVSIHAPHAGRDPHEIRRFIALSVSIHAPHAGRDLGISETTLQRKVSIHAPHAGRDRGNRDFYPARIRFNPRAPCGARPSILTRCIPRSMFQSTRPVRGATAMFGRKAQTVAVSIHAPRAGRDGFLDAPLCFCISFNPRAPCGARQMGYSIVHVEKVFQSTRPVRGATKVSWSTFSMT